MEKTITIKNSEITFSIWDLGGQREFISMLPLVCNDAVATLFMFDLSNKSSLASVKEWYRQVRGMNRNSFAFLIGKIPCYFSFLFFFKKILYFFKNSQSLFYCCEEDVFFFFKKVCTDLRIKHEMVPLFFFFSDRNTTKVQNMIYLLNYQKKSKPI